MTASIRKWPRWVKIVLAVLVALALWILITAIVQDNITAVVV